MRLKQKKAEIEAAAVKETEKMKLEAQAERDRREFELLLYMEHYCVHGKVNTSETRTNDWILR